LGKFLTKPQKEETMHIVIEENGPVVKGLPEGNEILFFGKIGGRMGYGVIYGPPKTCLPTEGYAELWDARVAFGELGTEMTEYQVKHGHKYSQGGGFVEFGGAGPSGRNQIFFRPPGHEKKCLYDGRQVEELYIAL
jgi:hypothetical protein